MSIKRCGKIRFNAFFGAHRKRCQSIKSNMATWNGSVAWEKDPDLLSARLIIAEIDKPLTHLIRRHPRYKLMYEDKTAAVFVANESML